MRAIAEAGHRRARPLPTRGTRPRVDSALAWRMVPMDVDLVIATNFPSYFVRHPNKVVWLFHQHRGFYDGADAAWSDIGLDDASLEAQRLMVEWDAAALGEARHVFSTSGVVAARLARYCGLVAEPLYHPPPLHDLLHPGSFGDYVFCATRLERNKRPDLLAGALPHLRSDVRVSIAGTGSIAASWSASPDDRAARSSSQASSRRRARRSYAGRAGGYVPFDEEYGYVLCSVPGRSRSSNTAPGRARGVEDASRLVVEPTPRRWPMPSPLAPTPTAKRRAKGRDRAAGPAGLGFPRSFGRVVRMRTSNCCSPRAGTAPPLAALLEAGPATRLRQPRARAAAPC